MSTIVTNSQKAAQRAFTQVGRHEKSKSAKEYLAFARQFPTLVHTCGLAQALAFAKAKGYDEYLLDLAKVADSSPDRLLTESRNHPVAAYMRLTRQVMTAATWLKTYAETLLDAPESKDKSTGDGPA